MLDVDSRPDQVGGSPGSDRRWRMPWFTAAMSLLIFVGVLVLMYPSVASWFSQYNQSLLIEDVVGGDVEKGPPSRLEADSRSERERAWPQGARLLDGDRVWARGDDDGPRRLLGPAGAPLEVRLDVELVPPEDGAVLPEEQHLVATWGETPDRVLDVVPADAPAGRAHVALVDLDPPRRHGEEGVCHVAARAHRAQVSYDDLVELDLKGDADLGIQGERRLDPEIDLGTE